MSTVRCKAKGCRFKPLEENDFCAKCTKKLKKGLLSEDGRLKKDICKADSCSRSTKRSGWCGICFKKFQSGYFNSDGKLSSKAELEIKAKARRAKKREANRAKKEMDKKKKELSNIISLPVIKELRGKDPSLGEAFGCPRLKIFVDPATCLHRLFVKANRECKGCIEHDSLVEDILSKQQGVDNDEEVSS